MTAITWLAFGEVGRIRFAELTFVAELFGSQWFRYAQPFAAVPFVLVVTLDAFAARMLLLDRFKFSSLIVLVLFLLERHHDLEP